MANAIYPLYKQALLQADANTDIVAGDVKIALVDTGVYTYSAAHQFESDLTGIVAESQSLTTKSATSGVFDADDVSAVVRHVVGEGQGLSAWKSLHQ